MKTVSSRLDFPNRVILPSSETFVFSTDELAAAHLISFLGAALHLDDEQARERLRNFIDQFRHQLRLATSFQWKGIGEFSMNTSGVVQLNGPSDSSRSHDALPAEKIIRSGNTHTIRVGEEEKSKEEMEVLLQQKITKKRIMWWVLAVILFLVGGIGLWSVSHFFSKEWKRQGNYHPIQAQPAPEQYQRVP